jgi:hypothetical protein
MPEELQQTAADTEQKRVNRTTRGSPTGAVAFLVFGVVFTGVGTAVLRMTLRGLNVGHQRHNNPGWVVLVGAIFAGVGLLMLVRGVLAARRAWHRRQLRNLYPGEPWRADFPWDPAGCISSDRPDEYRSLGWGLFLLIFTAPFQFIAFHLWGTSTEGAIMFTLIPGLFDLLGLGMIGWAVYLFLRRLKYGDSRLQYESFPFFLGDVLTASVVPHKSVRGARRVTFTLRCIQERIEVTSSGRDSNTAEVCYQVWASSYEVEQPGDLAAGKLIPVTFLLPEETGLGTALSDRPPRYWELEVAAAAPGIGYKARFLVPVYVRAGKERAASVRG